MALVCLILQLVIGIFLAMHYKSYINFQMIIEFIFFIIVYIFLKTINYFYILILNYIDILIFLKKYLTLIKKNKFFLRKQRLLLRNDLKIIKKKMLNFKNSKKIKRFYNVSNKVLVKVNNVVEIAGKTFIIAKDTINFTANCFMSEKNLSKIIKEQVKIKSSDFFDDEYLSKKIADHRVSLEGVNVNSENKIELQVFSTFTSKSEHEINLSDLKYTFIP